MSSRKAVVQASSSVTPTWLRPERPATTQTQTRDLSGDPSGLSAMGSRRVDEQHPPASTSLICEVNLPGEKVELLKDRLGRATQSKMRVMPVQFALVHSPLVGPESWRLVATALVADGHDVLVPDLKKSIAAGPPYFTRQVEAIADAVGKRPVILVGHSGAGPLLASAGNSLEHVRGYLFVDAGLPGSGRSWMEEMPQELALQLRDMADGEGWLPPWPEWLSSDELADLVPDAIVRTRFVGDCPRLPLAMFEEVHTVAPRWRDAPAGYLQLSAAYEDQATEARALGWPVVYLEKHHLALLTDPDLVMRSLLALHGELHTKRLQRPAFY